MELSPYSQVHSLFHSAREYLNPILISSKFKEGLLTPDEFILAGDFLVGKCPTWAWSGGLKSKARDYLPLDKQYLVTRNVPCLGRASFMDLDEVDDGDFTVLPTPDIAQPMPMPMPMDATPSQDIPDLDDLDGLDELDELQGMAIPSPGDKAMLDESHILKTRTYDISITYDKYYQTPRVWLTGYDESKNPLTSVQIFEDISQDHARKTVTIEAHPHEDCILASIHPCKHGNVMKLFLDHYGKSGKSVIRVDQYLILFLKFMSSVLPTMEYDCTISLH